MDPLDAFSALANEISALRGAGHATVGWQELEEGAAPRLDHFLDDLGLAPVPERELRAVSREGARGILQSALARDLREREEVMSAADAEGLAERFLGFFGAGARFLTNGVHEADGTLREWIALGTTGLDTGILALDAGQLGLLWIEDEPEEEEDPEPEI